MEADEGLRSLVGRYLNQIEIEGTGIEPIDNDFRYNVAYLSVVVPEGMVTEYKALKQKTNNGGKFLETTDFKNILRSIGRDDEDDAENTGYGAVLNAVLDSLDGDAYVEFELLLVPGRMRIYIEKPIKSGLFMEVRAASNARPNGSPRPSAASYEFYI